MKLNPIMRLSTKIFMAVFAALYVAVEVFLLFSVNVFAAFLFPLFYLLPAAIAVWFVLSAVLYVRAKKRGDEDLPALKTRLTVATALLIMLAVLFVLLIGFFAMAVMYM